MTHITITEKTNLYGIEVKGHSGYADLGYDIVCAGISALSEAFMLTVESYEERGNVELKIEEISEGYIKLLYFDARGVLKPAIDMFRLGIEGIRDIYPDNLTVFHNI